MKSEEYLEGRGIESEVLYEMLKKHGKLITEKYYREKDVIKALELKEKEKLKTDYQRVIRKI